MSRRLRRVVVAGGALVVAAAGAQSVVGAMSTPGGPPAGPQGVTGPDPVTPPPPVDPTTVDRLVSVAVTPDPRGTGFALTITAEREHGTGPVYLLVTEGRSAAPFASRNNLTYASDCISDPGTGIAQCPAPSTGTPATISLRWVAQPLAGRPEPGQVSLVVDGQPVGRSLGFNPLGG